MTIKTCAKCGKEKDDVYISELFGNKCWDCRKKEEQDRMSEIVKRDGYSTCEHEAYCPYCGFPNEIESESYGNDTTECYECEKEFNLTTEYDVTFSTTKIED